MPPPEGRIRVMRVISRLNVGGPAIQAITLTRRMTGLGYDTLLVRGQEGEHEGSMEALASDLGVRPLLLGGLRRESPMPLIFVPSSAFSGSMYRLPSRPSPHSRFKRRDDQDNWRHPYSAPGAPESWFTPFTAMFSRVTSARAGPGFT